MAFILNTDVVEYLRAYSEARHFYETTKPIRGRDKDVDGVPLHKDRRNWHKYRLIKRGTDYSVRLYQTDVVTWHTNGDITLDWSYGSRSTSDLVNLYAPLGFGVDNKGITISVSRNRMTPKQRARYEAEGNGVYHMHRRTPTFICHGKTRLVYSKKLGHHTLRDTPVAYRQELSTKLTAPLRKKVEPFIQYLKTVCAMTPPESAERAWGVQEDEAKHYFKNKSLWHEMAMHYYKIGLKNENEYFVNLDSEWSFNFERAKRAVYEDVYAQHEGKLTRLKRVPFGYYSDNCVTKGETR